MECNSNNKTGLGTDVMLSIKLELPGGLKMDDVNFSAQFKTYVGKSISIDKSEMRRISENEYVAIVPTSKIGIGVIKYEISVDIPAEGDVRKEIVKGETTTAIY